MKKKEVKRVVVKIGTSILTHNTGKPNFKRIDNLVRQLVDLKNQEKEILLVTSGAIGAGMGEMGLIERPDSIPEQQALAALGQGVLIGLYNKFLREYGEVGAQILLTASDLEDRRRFLNAFNTLSTLLKYGVIPIINENDTVATAEIKFGDNDTLSALVATLVEADLLIILSDIEGLYNGDPKDEESDLQLINKVEKITPAIESLAGDKGSDKAIGGMITKLKAAKIVNSSGINMVIAPGYRENVISDIIKMIKKGEEYNLGTTFLAGEVSLCKRKQWLCYNLSTNGTIMIDKGAEEALLNKGKSLLPGGIIKVKGDFIKGDPVKIINGKGQEIGKGLVNYSSEEVNKIKGHHSQEIKEILGFFNQADVIHRDNMVILK